MQEQRRHLSDEDLLHLPFGPLTPEAYDRLGRSHYDATQSVAQRVAIERGVTPSDYMGHLFRKRLGEAGINLSQQPTAETTTLDS